MPDDDDEDVDLWKEVVTPVELLESASLGCIEMLRRRRVCLYPGPDLPVQPGDITDFGQCLPYLGDCNTLIFCAPHHDKREARARIRQYIGGGGDLALVLDLSECVGVEDDWVENDDLLFPGKADSLLVTRFGAQAEPEATRPPDVQFWAHYAILSFVGRAEKLHLLHLGLPGDYAWPYFLAPHGIRVARMITNL